MAKAKPEPREKRKTLVALKGEPEWLEWANRYADFLGVSVSVAIDLAMRGQSRRDGFDEPMPKRFAR
jgi:hypothetical protein